MKKVCLQCMIGDSDYWTISSHNLYLKSRLPIPEFSARDPINITVDRD